MIFISNHLQMIIIFGLPGAEKSTLANQLVTQIGIKVLDPDIIVNILYKYHCSNNFSHPFKILELAFRNIIYFSTKYISTATWVIISAGFASVDEWFPFIVIRKMFRTQIVPIMLTWPLGVSIDRVKARTRLYHRKYLHIHSQHELLNMNKALFWISNKISQLKVESINEGI
jgi:shikimate kinase